MEFALSEEQEILMDSVKKMLDENISIDNLREHSKGDDLLRKCLRKLIIDMGLPGLMIPEEYGGSGLGVLEASLVAEQLGSYAAPSPWIGNSIMAPTAILFDKKIIWLKNGFH